MSLCLSLFSFTRFIKFIEFPRNNGRLLTLDYVKGRFYRNLHEQSLGGNRDSTRFIIRTGCSFRNKLARHVSFFANNWSVDFRINSIILLMSVFVSFLSFSNLIMDWDWDWDWEFSVQYKWRFSMSIKCGELFTISFFHHVS